MMMIATFGTQTRQLAPRSYWAFQLSRSMGSKRSNKGGNRRPRGRSPTAENNMPPKRPSNKWMKKMEKQQQEEREKFVPPVMLAPTGSRNVFVAQAALDENIDPSLLFDNHESRPLLFSKNEFEYVPPGDLKSKYLQYARPEVAFLGRSNVGKSSLINALMRKDLCITSKSPGRTQLSYYYGLFPKIEEKAPADAIGYIIDLPGYGFAAAPKEKAEEWQAATQTLLLERRDVLKRLFLLIDTRREGPAEIDLIVIKWLEEAEIPFSIVLTKSDRTSLPLIVKQVNETCLRYTSQLSLSDVVSLSPIVHVTSSKQKQGINELLQSIEAEFLGEEDNDEN